MALFLIAVASCTTEVVKEVQVPGETIVVEKETIAAHATGSSTIATLRRHVLPNVMPVFIIIFSISVGGVILAEASLSFLGFGLPAKIPSWGSMLSRDGRQFMEIAPRLALWPGVALTIVIYCLNMFGDAMRDLLDPRLRGAGN